jgi:hypothetical protein
MKQLFVLIVICGLFVMPAVAGTGTFTNGGFEDNSFNGWVTGGGYWNGESVTPADYLPGGDHYDPTVFADRSAVVGVGVDPITGLSTVYSGTHAARVNDYTPDSHVSVISQTVTNYNDPSIFFAWAAVLEESHTEIDSDYFSLTLTDDTTGAVLYSVNYNSASAQYAGLFHEVYYDGTYSNWFYTDWQIAQLDVSQFQGDTFTLTLLGSDCPWGGHGGYVYLDGFGNAPPPPTVPEPASLALASAGLGLLLLKMRTRK